MKGLYEDVAELVARAEAAISKREREDPSTWAMTAFSRYRVAEMAGIEPNPVDRVESGADPVVLLEEAARRAGQLDVLAERPLLAEALRCALADVRMVCGARDV